MTDKSESTQAERSDAPSALRVSVGLVVVFAVMMGTLLGISMYMEWQEEGWGQHACEEEYGESADYIGRTSAFGGSGICEVDGEQKYVEVVHEGLIPPGDSDD